MKILAGLLCVMCGEPAEFSCDSRHAVQESRGVKLIRKGDVLLGARDELRRSPMRYKVLEVIPIWLGRRMLFGYLTLMGELKATATLKVKWTAALACGTFSKVRFSRVFPALPRDR